MPQDAPDERPKDQRQAWNDVAERFTSWGRLVGERYRDRGSTEAGGGERGPEETARELSEQLNRAFTALGDTLRDAEATAQLKDAVKALGDAVSISVNETAEQVKRRIRTDDAAGSNGDAGTADPPPPPPPGTPG